MTAIVKPLHPPARRPRRVGWPALGAGGVVAMMGGWIVAGSLVPLLWSVGEPKLALVVGVLAIACLMAALGEISGEPLRPEKQGIWKLDEPEWDLLVEAVERGARDPSDDPAALGPPPHMRPVDDDGFEDLVRDALDELPAFLQRELEEGNVVVLVSDDGHEHRAYGLYRGGTVANDAYVHEIVIFRDTLVRDFGTDPDELRRQVTITVRHELAHHLGAYEDHVARLGL